MSVPVAIVVSLASIVLGWVIYDRLCKSPIGQDDTRLMLVLFVVLVAMAWLYTQLFTGRAALLHLGAFTGTIMVANVAMIIIPNQKKVVAALKAGETPDPEYGRVAKQRSTHNNYLTLPVLFLMLSIHYPLIFATPYNWVIASLVFLMGVTIRHFFNTMHAGRGWAYWTWPATVALFLAVVWLSTVSPTPVEESAALSTRQERFAAAEAFPEVHNTVLGRCSMCHAAEPFWPGIAAAPKGVVLETEAQTAHWAEAIYLQAGRSHAMPPANLTWMEPAGAAADRRMVRGRAPGRLSGLATGQGRGQLLQGTMKAAAMPTRLPIEQGVLEALCRCHHIKKLSLFGSTLKGTARPDSDIDLLVEFEPEAKPSLFDLAQIEIELAEEIGGHKVDLRTPNELSRLFRDQVMREALVQYDAG